MYGRLTDKLKHELEVAKPILKQGVSEYLLLRNLNRKSKFSNKQTADLPVEFDCFISSEKGVFRLVRGQLIRVFSAWTMGMAVADSKIYLSCAGRSEGSSSVVLVGELKAFLHEGVSYKFKELYRLPLLFSKHRVHQICLAGDYLWIANTGRNTLLQLHRESGEVVTEVAPFLDRFGRPVYN